ncbi:MAG: hypothetical protein PHV28_07750, partial [Kiritimatiellae bacterium]|nr:hypothetical protein [Kiritimatiellia bacterium]
MKSLKENETGRELVARKVAFVRARLPGEKNRRMPRSFERRGDRLVWTFADGLGEVSATVRNFAGGWLFRTETMTVKDAYEIELGCLVPVCEKYYGGSLSMRSDDTSGVAVIDCGLDLEMTVFGDFGIYVTAGKEHGFVGKTFGLVAGPRPTLVPSLQALTVEAGVRPSLCGGAWALSSDQNRSSYLFVFGLSTANVEGWIDVAKLISAGVIHQDRWYETLGEYNVKRDLYPRGFADMKVVTDKIRAAGLKAGMHMLTGCINVNDGLVAKRVHELQEWCSYTLAQPFAADSTELVVNEPIDRSHDVVYTYSGNGNFLLVGDEIVQYAALRRERPYAFLGLKRAVCGTKTGPSVPAGSRVGYLQQRYRAFYPKEDSKLADDLADNIARVYNDGGFDQIYFDGAEGMGTQHKTDVMCRKIYDRLARPPIAEGGGFRHSWWWRSRKGAWDGSHWASKRFVDTHIAHARSYKMSDLVQPQMGWWHPRAESEHSRGHFLDEMEYWAGKNVSIDAAFATKSDCPGQLSDEGRRQLELLGTYERFRLDRRFTDEALKALGNGRDEFRLRKDKAGVWTLTPAESFVRRAGSDTDRAWRLDGGPRARRAALRVEALYVAGAGDGLEIMPAGTVPTTYAHSGPNYFDCGTNRVLHFSIRGDGSGAVLRLRVTTPREFSFAESDHHFLVDFTGWRELSVPFREREVEGAWFYEPPKFGHGSTFMNPLAYGHISKLDFTVVKEGAKRDDPIAFSPICVVPQVPVTSEKPS